MNGDDEESGGSAALTAGIVSVVVIVVLLGGAAYVIMYTRLAPRLRARITRKPYGDIILPGGAPPQRSESTQNVVA